MTSISKTLDSVPIDAIKNKQRSPSQSRKVPEHSCSSHKHALKAKEIAEDLTLMKLVDVILAFLQQLEHAAREVHTEAARIEKKARDMMQRCKRQSDYCTCETLHGWLLGEMIWKDLDLWYL